MKTAILQFYLFTQMLFTMSCTPKLHLKIISIFLSIRSNVFCIKHPLYVNIKRS